MSLLILKDITLESSSQPGHFLEEIVHLILEFHLDGRVVDKANLLSRESSVGIWDADQILILQELDKESVLCVLMQFDIEEYQLLGRMELDAPSLYERLGEQVEIPLLGDGNLVLKAKPAAMLKEDAQRLALGVDQTGDLEKETTEIDDLLANALSQIREFQRSGRLEYLEEAISQFQLMSNATSEDDPIRRIILNNLAASLFSRFERLGRIEDLDNGIRQLQTAINLTPDGHPDKPVMLIGLGNSLYSRFKRCNSVDDLNNAITQEQAAVQLTPDGHPEKSDYLGNIAISFLTRFKSFGNIDDFNKAFEQVQAAVNLSSDSNPNKPKCLNILAGCLQTQFERLGSVDDLKNAIVQLQMAIKLAPNSDAGRSLYLNNLGVCLAILFERFGNSEDLDDAIAQQQVAVKLSPDDDPQTPLYLNSLGNSLHLRFQHFGNIEDLNNGIAQKLAAVKISPNDHVEKPLYLNNLGVALLIRFEHLRNIGDLNNAIVQEQAAVKLIPNDHPDRPKYLNNLGNSLRSRFQHCGDTEDLDNAIVQHQEAVKLTPDGHPDKTKRLSGLGISLQSRFRRFENIEDLDDSIANHHAAIELTPDGHPDKSSHLQNLGTAMLFRYIHLHDLRDAEAAISHYSASAQSLIGSPSHRLKSATSWIRIASMINHPTLLLAYECALAIIPRVAWLGLSVKDRHQHLVQTGAIAREAAATAISRQEYGKAVEWLEQGRSIVWTQILQLRTPVDQLRDIDPNLADQLTRVSRLLDTGIQQSDIHDGKKLSREEEGQRSRALAKQWEEIVEKIRSLPNFQDFLRTPNLSRLFSAAANGPVVVVNVAKERCDALVLIDGLDEVVHIPLPDFTLEKATKLQDDLRAFLKLSNVRLRAIRLPADDGDEEGECKQILRELWKCLVNPVLDSLAFSPHPDTLPRIWWCVTGPLAFLPIHAAGLYDDESPDSQIQNYVISSYIPTLSVLLDSSKTMVDSSFKMLSVIEPSSGKWHIPNTIVELEKIRNRIKDEDHTVLLGPDATKGRVMNAMKDCNWLHLACHGTQNVRSPTNSALKLRGGDLTLEEIIRLNLPHAECAFLSACQTVTGEETLSEEAVHIAGGMLLAGYRSVVATMWSIEDKLAPEVADEFYRHLAEGGERLDNRKTAEALHLSVQKLRQRPGIRMVSWIPFVHLGQ